MKKFLILLATTVVMMSAQASQLITVYWAFPASDSPINYVRALLDRANQMQNRYTFVMISTPGAGGAIGANKALSSTDPAMLATAHAFFSRPMLFSDAGYKFDDFQLSTLLSVAPWAIVTRRDFDESRLYQGMPVTIGISGLGSSTHVVAERIKNRFNNVTIVPFKGLGEAIVAVKGGHIDMSLETVKSAEQHSDLKIFGTTGSRKVKTYKLLSDFGVLYTENAVLGLFLLRPKTMSANMSADVDQILEQANADNPMLKSMYSNDIVFFYNLKTQEQKAAWYQEQITGMRNLTRNIKIDQ